MRGPRSTDVAVIGGGYSGLSSALHLLTAGANVIVLEAGEVGCEASGRNNGQVIPTLKKEDPEHVVAKLGERRGSAMVALMRDAAEYVFRLIEKHDIQCDAEQSGWIQPAHSKSHMKLVENRFLQWQSHGAAVELLDRSMLIEHVGTRYYCGGWRAVTGGHIQPLSFARGLAGAVIRAGGELYTQTPALGITRTAGQWTIGTPQGSVRAEQIILATQATTPRALWPGLASSVVPVTFYQVATEPLTDVAQARVLPGREAMSDMQGDINFLRYERTGRLITGGTLICETNWKRRIEHIVHDRLNALFPYLSPVALSNHWTGTTAMSTDFYPHLFSLGPGAWAWMGCNSRGIALTTSMGRIMAELVLRGPGPETPLPVERLRQNFLNALLRRLAPYSLLYYRMTDRYYRLRARLQHQRKHMTA